MSRPQHVDESSPHVLNGNIGGISSQMRERDSGRPDVASGSGRLDAASERGSGRFYGDGGSSSQIMWICSICRYSNESSRGQCMMCRRPKGACEIRRPAGSAPRRSRTTLAEYRERVLQVQQRRGGIGEMLSAVVPGLTEGQGLISGAITASVTATFALVGAGMGAVAGAMAGRATDSGVLRGFGLGAIAGAVVTVEALDVTRSFWRTTRANGGAQNISEVVQSLNHFLDERWGTHPRQEQSGVTEDDPDDGEWQVDIDNMSYDEMYDLFGGRPTAPGVPPEAIVAMSKRVVGAKEVEERDVESVCAICLNGYECGQALRVLPGCQHEFHQMCVDRWLYEVGRCPVCRNLVPYDEPGHPEQPCGKRPDHCHQENEVALPDSPRLGNEGAPDRENESTSSGHEIQGMPPDIQRERSTPLHGNESTLSGCGIESMPADYGNESTAQVQERMSSGNVSEGRFAERISLNDAHLSTSDYGAERMSSDRGHGQMSTSSGNGSEGMSSACKSGSTPSNFEHTGSSVHGHSVARENTDSPGSPDNQQGAMEQEYVHGCYEPSHFPPDNPLLGIAPLEDALALRSTPP